MTSDQQRARSVIVCVVHRCLRAYTYITICTCTNCSICSLRDHVPHQQLIAARQELIRVEWLGQGACVQTRERATTQPASRLRVTATSAQRDYHVTHNHPIKREPGDASFRSVFSTLFITRPHTSIQTWKPKIYYSTTNLMMPSFSNELVPNNVIHCITMNMNVIYCGILEQPPTMFDNIALYQPILDIMLVYST